jgi:ribose/xylose/arabinose/galactoside ABC-type transport system permease subunit
VINPNARPPVGEDLAGQGIGATVDGPASARSAGARRRLALSLPAVNRFGGVYVLLAMIVVFSILSPSTFPHVATIAQVLDVNSVSAMAALILVVPLAAGVFDVSVPYTMTLSGVVAAYAIVDSHLSIFLAILIAVGVSLLVGLVNGLVIIVGKVDSLIATIATGFLIQALVQWRTGGLILSGTQLDTGAFSGIAYHPLFSTIDIPVLYVAVLATALWYLLQHTATGRRIYATGFKREAARLASVRTDRLRLGCLILSSFLAGLTGVVLAANLGSGSPTGGNNYLLAMFAGVFLGETQLRPGRFNAWGTVLAILILGVLTTGLSLAGVPLWGQQLSDGVVLVVALILHARGRASIGSSPQGRRRPRKEQSTTAAE